MLLPRSLPVGLGLLTGLLILPLSILPRSIQGATTTYLLANHPDGSAGPPAYGLRLDELFDVTCEHDVFSFDFEAPGASMTLVYDDNDSPSPADDMIRISGIAVGGLDTGDGYGDPSYFGMWQVDFVYTTNITQGGNDVEVGGDSPSNNGTITPLFSIDGSMDPIPLVDEQGDHSFSFRFNNVDDHRLGDFPELGGPEIFVGWGWLNHSGQEHVKASDWLFTAVIPEPGTAALLALGLAGLGFAGRKRTIRH